MSSKEVFALRKSGSLSEAFAMAAELVKQNASDEWNIKAFAWCAYDLAKNAIVEKNYSAAQKYVQQLTELNISSDDDVLYKSIEKIKTQCNPERQIILTAKEKSKQGLHSEALVLFRQAIQKFPDDFEVNEQFGWELYKEGKILFEKEPIDVVSVRKLLAEYIKLKNTRPSRLHSHFLRFADKIIENESFNLVSFIKLWGLDNLMEEDYEGFQKDGKTYPSLGEKVIQHASKMIEEKKITADVDYILPYLNSAISKFPENIWLTYNKAKLLHLVNRNEDAITSLIPVVKEKISDYWAWGLLGDILLRMDADKAISCYCKALLCRTEEKFVGGIRISLAEQMIQKKLYHEAKHEIALVIKSKNEQGVKIPERIRELQSNGWYDTTVERDDNIGFYNKNLQAAEEIIFSYLPWLDGCIGESFTTPEKPDKPRRKLFIKGGNNPIEVVVSDKKFNISKRFKAGDAIKVKGEYDNEKIFRVYLLDKRHQLETWDIFPWTPATVVHSIKDGDKISGWKIAVNSGRNIIEGNIAVSLVPDNLILKEGYPINAKFIKKELGKQPDYFSFKKEIKPQYLAITNRVEGKLWDIYPESIGVIDHINQEKGVAHFIVNRQTTGVVHLNKLNGKIEIGSCLSVKLRKVTKEKESYFTTLEAALTTENPIEKLVMNFQGEVKLSGTVGFVKDIYVDSSTLQKHNIEDGQQIKGIAILNFNQKKAAWGWKAFKIAD